MSWLSKWNTKLYWNNDRTQREPGFQAEEFWETFQIKSWPKFKNACAYHIPSKWVDDVSIMIYQIRNELGDQIEFVQIKEKLCRLVVYFNSTTEEAKTRADELVRECVDRLITKGVCPSKQEKEND